MTVYDANERDARYLASQLQTNARILKLRESMQAARNRLHDSVRAVALEEPAGASLVPEEPPVVSIPAPPIDFLDSAPRTRTASGMQLKAAAAAVAVAAITGGSVDAPSPAATAAPVQGLQLVAARGS